MKDYLSYSQLKAFAKSPNHYLAYLQEEFEPTPAMTLGSALHSQLLTPGLFLDQYAVAQKHDRRTKAGKAAAEEQDKLLEGKTVITPEQMDTIQKIVSAVLLNRHAQAVLQQAQGFEVEKFGVIHGERFKAIADMVGDTWVADLKTCADASPEGFMRAAHNLDYHLQAAIYRAVFGVSEFYWIAVETSAPFNVQVYKQSEEAKLFSDRRLYNLIQAYQRWDGNPQGYSSQILSLDLPRWAN
jgi:hypothetical protein